MDFVPLGMMYSLGIGSTFIAPVVYFPAATAVCCEVLGVIVVPAWVDRLLVLDPLTVTVPAVPLETYPADTVGVTLLVADVVAVMTPVELFTLMLGLAVIDVAGVVADPLATDLLAAEP